MASINPQFQQIGEQFTQHYYQIFDSNRQGLVALYNDSSLLTFEGEQFMGATSIVQKIVSLPFQTVQHQVVKADCQPNPSNGGVIVFVTGNLIVDGGAATPLKFAQVFHLAPSGGSFFCQNDMFRLNIG
mmetsp:Transcript_35955/g.86580  ORF Transcript_35955/g.86580 Transcript_35955/m.86580 type:complete len:129 (-) Transcript_35955:385-771(-)